MTPEVGSTANSYEILSKLAEGGMAEIFLARAVSSTGVRRHVVLKRVARERALDIQYVQMFLDEARLAAQLQHPNIAQVFDIGKLGTSYFFTMEYVHGVTVLQLLERAVERGVQLPVAAVLSIIAGAAAGLGHAHLRTGHDGRPLGIVHRDVSPSNLMVSYEGHIKVVDFGVAKVIGRPETQAGTIKGKVAYLSPEQCRQVKLDSRSDLFSLGIVMWEMLTGQRLFKRDTPFDTMAAIATEPAPLPSRLRADIPPSVDVIVRKLLSIEVDQRLQTAAQVIEAVEGAAIKTKSIVTPATLSRLLRELFGVQPEPWLALEREVVTVISRPIPSDLNVDVEADQKVEAKLTQQFSSVTIPPPPGDDEPTRTTDVIPLTGDPETEPRARLPTPVGMRPTRVVPSLADAPAVPGFDAADELSPGEDVPTLQGKRGSVPPQNQVQLVRTLPLQPSVRPRGASQPPVPPTVMTTAAPFPVPPTVMTHAVEPIVEETQTVALDALQVAGQRNLASQPMTIRGSGSMIPPSGPRASMIPIPGGARAPFVRVPGGIPQAQQLPLRWWILGGSVLGIALTALIVVATRSDPEQQPAAIEIDAAVRTASADAAPPPIDAAIAIDAPEPAVRPPTVPEIEPDPVPDPDPEPLTQVPALRTPMRTRTELNAAFRERRFKDIVATCRAHGATGDKANVCTRAACEMKSSYAQEWYRNVAPEGRPIVVKKCNGFIEDTCAIDPAPCRN